MRGGGSRLARDARTRRVWHASQERTVENGTGGVKALRAIVDEVEEEQRSLVVGERG